MVPPRLPKSATETRVRGLMPCATIYKQCMTSHFLRVTTILTAALFSFSGPGAAIDYRTYVDSGYVLSAMTALAPVCPLIGPFAFLYFVMLSPMIRFMVVFAYRPRFDSGGDKWPKLHHMVITSLLLGQVLTMFTFLLKGNYVAGVLIGACIIPTLIFNNIVLEKFKLPFNDASLHFTGRLQRGQHKVEENEDRWKEREEFRRWLVDCHKASYVPTCMSGSGKNLLTADPAQTIPIIKQPDGESAADYYNKGKDKRAQFSRQSALKEGVMRRQRYGL